MGKPKQPTKPFEELECENCGMSITEDESDSNDGYCDECAYQLQENIEQGY
jgi:predicted amidophosphoribosyltransferase